MASVANLTPASVTFPPASPVSTASSVVRDSFTWRSWSLAAPQLRFTNLLEPCKWTAVGVSSVATAYATYTAAAALGAATSGASLVGCLAGFTALVQSKYALLGRRHDGTPVQDSTLMRKIMPYLMRTRNESSVMHEQIINLRDTRPFIERWNQTHATPITVFHLIIAAICRNADVRPGLDRFVVGGRLYQRHEPTVSFAVKREFKDYASLRTVKFKVVSGDPLETTVSQLQTAISAERRTQSLRPVERETQFFTALPGWTLSMALYAQKFLDRYGLLPAFATRNDPLYTSIFLANLGSLGLDRVWHHIYEYGTASLFGSVGKIHDEVIVEKDGTLRVDPTVHIKWTFDERIADGGYCAKALAEMGKLVEQPQAMLLERTPESINANLRADRDSQRAAFQLEKFFSRRRDV